MIVMDVIKLKDYLLDCSQEELTKRLMKLDASIMALHKNGYYIVGFDANNINVYNGEYSLESFNNKLDRLDSGYNDAGDKKDILEMCAVGICAYNGFSNFYINDGVIKHFITNFDSFCKNGKIPNQILEYYQSVLVNGEYEYLNSFLYKKEHDSNNKQVLGNSNRLTKSTAIGRAFQERSEAAFASILLLPAIATLIIITIMVGYLFFV